jgi:hypothetical protein
VRNRSIVVIMAVAAVSFVLLTGIGPASAVPSHTTEAMSAEATPAGLSGARSACTEHPDASGCDRDNDRIPDVVEMAVCRTATCATGREDSDRDGIADWVEYTACGSKSCASTKKDTDRDGIPDFAEILTCGSAVCSGGRDDADADKIADWVEFVICGDRSCANGGEDYDGNSIADAKELAACVVKYGVTGPASLLAPPPVTITIVSEDSAVGESALRSPPLLVETFSDGQVRIQLAWWPLIVGALMAALALASLGWVALLLRRRRRNDAEAADVDSELQRTE